MSLGVVKAILAGLQRPFAPGSDHLQLRGERLVGVLEANLVIAFTGAAMSDGFCAFFEGDLDLVFGNHRTGNRRAEQILVFVDRARLDGGEDKIADELFAQVAYDDLLCPCFIGLVDNSVDVFALTDVGDHGDDVHAIVFVQPRNDDRGIKTA